MRWSHAALSWAMSARILLPRSIALCQALLSDRPSGPAGGDTNAYLPAITSVVTVVSRASPPAGTTPAAAPGPAAPNPAADIRDVLSQVGIVNRFVNASGHCDR